MELAQYIQLKENKKAATITICNWLWKFFEKEHESIKKFVRIIGTQDTKLIQEYITEHNPNINGRNHRDCPIQDCSPLVKAIRTRNKDVVKVILDAGADPELKDNYGRMYKEHVIEDARFYRRGGNNDFFDWMDYVKKMDEISDLLRDKTKEKKTYYVSQAFVRYGY